MDTTAFIGLGAMGEPMAAHLAQRSAQNGTRTLVWNRTPGKAEAHAERYGSHAATLAEVGQADLIFTCLPTSAEVDEIINGLRPYLKRGAYWVDCTSGHPRDGLRQRAVLEYLGVHFIDAPVSGGTAGAKAGQLTVMLGGPEAEVEAVLPHLAFAGKALRVGESGAGFAVKAMNNALLAVTLWATGESLAILARQGVNLGAALEVINASSGRSNSSQNLIPQRVLTREFPATFALGLLAKDAAIALDLIQETKGSAPVLAQTAELTRAASNMIGATEDHTAALRLIEQMNGVTLQ